MNLCARNAQLPAESRCVTASRAQRHMPRRTRVCRNDERDAGRTRYRPTARRKVVRCRTTVKREWCVQRMMAGVLESQQRAALKARGYARSGTQLLQRQQRVKPAYEDGEQQKMQPICENAKVMASNAKMCAQERKPQRRVFARAAARQRAYGRGDLREAFHVQAGARQAHMRASTFSFYAEQRHSMPRTHAALYAAERERDGARYPAERGRRGVRWRSEG